MLLYVGLDVFECKIIFEVVGELMQHKFDHLMYGKVGFHVGRKRGKFCKKQGHLEPLGA